MNVFHARPIYVGTTVERTALGIALGSSAYGYRFFDTDEGIEYSWNGIAWKLGGSEFASLAESQAGVVTDKAVAPSSLPVWIIGDAFVNALYYDGDARGGYAVDLQSYRGGADQVASGGRSVIAGGRNNKASAYYTGILGGYGGIASGQYAAIAGGQSNTASGYLSAILGGSRAVASLYGERAWASGMFAVVGDAQECKLVARKSTADATPVELFLDGVDDRLVIPADTTWLFSILVAARRTDVDGESAGYKFEGVIDNDAGTVALVGAVTKIVLAEDTVAWDFNVTADDANNSLKLEATGEAAKTIYWVAVTTIVQVTG